MSKKNLIIFIICGFIIIGLIIFASTREYQDSHLRIEGVRVKLPSGSLVVEDSTCPNVASCTKDLTLNDTKLTLKFAFKNFKKNGYPETIVGTIGNKEFYREDDLTLDNEYSYDYENFSNFNVIADKYIAFTASNSINNLSTSLYVIDASGNVILKEYEIADDLYIKDSISDYITYNDNTITISVANIKNYSYDENTNICNLDKNITAEATYTYTLENAEFKKKELSKTTFGEYIKDNNITCESDE